MKRIWGTTCYPVTVITQGIYLLTSIQTLVNQITQDYLPTIQQVLMIKLNWIKNESVIGSLPPNVVNENWKRSNH